MNPREQELGARTRQQRQIHARRLPPSRAVVVALALALALATVAACTPRHKDPGPPSAARGKAVYVTTCTACHNADPSLAGPVGPAVKGASKELLEARLLHASYPPGYIPARVTHIMPAEPQLAGSVDDLAAYLAR